MFPVLWFVLLFFLLAVSVCFCCAVVVCHVCAVLLFSRVFRSVSCDRCRLVFSCSVFLFLSVCAVRFLPVAFVCRLAVAGVLVLFSVLVSLWLPVVLFCSSFPFFPLSCLSCFLLHVFLFFFLFFSLCSALSCLPVFSLCPVFFCGSAGVVSRCARGLSSVVACAWCCRHPVCCPVSVLMPVAGLLSVSVVPVFFLSVFLLSLRCVSFPVLFFSFFSSFSGFVFSLSVFLAPLVLCPDARGAGDGRTVSLPQIFCQWCFRG